MNDEHEHDWQIAFRDGPTDTTDWKCSKCPAYRQERGHDPPPQKDKKP